MLERFSQGGGGDIDNALQRLVQLMDEEDGCGDGASTTNQQTVHLVQ